MGKITRGKQTRAYGRTSRIYTLEDGSVFDSVTAILSIVAKPALINWAANQERELCIQASSELYEDFPAGGVKMSSAAYKETLERRLGQQKAHQKALEKAGNIGGQAHALIEWNLRQKLGQLPGSQPEVSHEASMAFGHFHVWAEQAELRPMRIEDVVYSREQEYAGTLDLYAALKGPDGREVHAVIDWKTGKAIYGEALLQNAAYIAALREMGHAMGETWGLIVRLPKVATDPGFEARWISPEEQTEHFIGFTAAKALWDWQKKLEETTKEGH